MNADDWLGMALKALRAHDRGRQDAVSALRALAARIERGEDTTLIAYQLEFQEPDSQENRHGSGLSG